MSTTYLGPPDYYQALVNAETVYLEACESWQKQSYRNRCYIDGPNGKLMLSIPVKASSTGLIKDVRVSYADKWPQKHWHAIKTTYSASPFFEVLGGELHAIYQQQPSFLWDLNEQLMHMVLDWLQHQVKINTTERWHEQAEEDYRDFFHPKREKKAELPPYPQIFDHKHGFTPNLSIVDLIFNEGPAALGYLKNL